MSGESDTMAHVWEINLPEKGDKYDSDGIGKFVVANAILFGRFLSAEQDGNKVSVHVTASKNQMIRETKIYRLDANESIPMDYAVFKQTMSYITTIKTATGSAHLFVEEDILLK